MIPMPEAVQALGEEHAANATLWVSRHHLRIFMSGLLTLDRWSQTLTFSLTRR